MHLFSLTFLSLLTLGYALSQSAHAASTQLCLRNTGDTPIQVGILYKGSWGGWIAHGWWQMEPQGTWGGCTLVPEGTGTSSVFYYMAVRQQGADGEWGWVGYDLSRADWENEGSYTIGGTIRLVPRSTLESSQGTSVWGLSQDLAGAKVILCAPGKGTKKIPTLDNQQTCPDNEILALFGTKLYAPSDGGFLQTNVYEIYFRSDKRVVPFKRGHLTGDEPSARKELSPKDPPPSKSVSKFILDQFVKSLDEKAEKGDVESQKTLAEIYMSGYFGDKNPDKAARLYLMAATSGDIDSYYEYAVLVLDGHVKTNGIMLPAAARAMLQIAADKGSVKAAKRLKSLPP